MGSRIVKEISGERRKGRQADDFDAAGENAKPVQQGRSRALIVMRNRYTNQR